MILSTRVGTARARVECSKNVCFDFLLLKGSATKQNVLKIIFRKCKFIASNKEALKSNGVKTETEDSANLHRSFPAFSCCIFLSDPCLIVTRHFNGIVSTLSISVSGSPLSETTAEKKYGEPLRVPRIPFSSDCFSSAFTFDKMSAVA